MSMLIALKTMKPGWRKASACLKGLTALMLGAYFWKILSAAWAEHQSVFRHFEGKAFFFSTLVLAAALSLLPLASKYSASLFMVHLPLRKSFQSYFYAQAGKYLPGGIWSYVGRVYLFHREGISKRTAFSMTLLEVLLLCLSGVVCFLIALYFWAEAPNALWVLSTIAFLAFVLCISAFFWTRPLPLFSERFGFHPDLAFQPGKLGLLLLVYVCFWEISGLAFYALTESMAPASMNRALAFAGIYPFAWILGKLAVFMPAGIGVREGALVYLLGFFLSPEEALWVSVLSRGWWIAAEGLCLLAVLLWSAFEQGRG